MIILTNDLSGEATKNLAEFATKNVFRIKFFKAYSKLGIGMKFAQFLGMNPDIEDEKISIISFKDNVM